MSGLTVTEQTGDTDGPSTDFIQFQQSLKEKLEKERDELLAEQKELMEGFSNPERKRRGRGTHKSDSETGLNETQHARLRIICESLKDVISALNRIKKGTFGICEDCEELIPVGRLKAIPNACCCIDCQEGREINGGSPPVTLD